MKCAVRNCANSSIDKNKKIRFFTFPKNTELRAKWIAFCSRDSSYKFEHARICSEHFKADDVENDLRFKMGFSKTSGCLKRGTCPSFKSPENENREPTPTAESILNESYSTENFSEDQLVDVLNAAHNEIIKLKATAAAQETEIAALKKSLAEAKLRNNKMEMNLKKIFTKGQVKKFKNDWELQYWSDEDIAESMTLYSISPRAYQLLLEKNFPFPSVRSLQRWTRNCKVVEELADNDVEP